MTAAILVQHTIQYENAEEGNLLHPEKPPEKRKDSHNLKRGDIKDLINIKDYDTRDRQYSKLPEKHEEDYHNLRRGDIKYLTNIKDYDTGDFQPYNGHYQNYNGELKDKEIMRPLRELRSALEIKNWVNDMIAMRGRGRRPHRSHHTTKKKGSTRTTKKPRPPQTTQKQRPSHTTKKSKGDSSDSSDSVDIYIKGSVKIRGKGDNNTEEEQILLEYTPKHKKVDVPMIFFVPSRE